MSSTNLQPLPSHEYFESLLIRQSNIEAPLQQKVNPLVIIYFTARWCGACKRLDIPALVGVRPDSQWFICDIDANEYTPGYCGVRAIPSFQAISHGKAQPLFSSSNTTEVARWLGGLPR